MQQYLTLIILSGCLIFSSCEEKGPDSSIITESDFVGTWTVPEFTGDFTVSGTFSGNPVDERGRSSISDSDLQIALYDDGRWASSGTYTMTVASEDDQEVTREEGVGGGTWSYQGGTLQLNGLENTNRNGFFENPQSCAVLDFVRSEQIGLLTEMDVTESDPDHDISLRTRGQFVIQLER